MAETTPIIGRTLSRYRILEEVGRGGMATVYRAMDTSLAREVAVKVLHPHLAGEAESKSRLEREAHAVAKLRHDNILEIFDYSGAASEAAESFIVTEFIRGPTLTAFLGRHRITVPEAAELIVHELAAALETAHRAGVIHRDIKPENVMIREGDGRVKLTDFGIAQIIDKERLTATGQLIGSPAYLAPELVEGGRVDFRTDVFSLGIVLYRVATGQLPFQGRNPHEMMKRIVECRYAPPDQVNPSVGRGLIRIIARAMARRPEDRYADMEALRRDLAADLAVAGIDDVRGELARFFADPEGWEKAARPRLTAALLASAKRETSRSAALALVGRALALSPGDAAAKAMLDRIGARQRRGKALVAVASAAVVVGGGAMALRYRATHRTSLPSPAATAEPPTDSSTAKRPSTVIPPAAVRTVAGAGAAGDATRHSSPSRTTARPPPAGPIAPRDLRLNFTSPTKALELFVDRRKVTDWDGVQKVIRVAGGVAHHVRLYNEFFYDQTECDVSSSDAATPELRMKWKPAVLVVQAPKGAAITIEPRHDPRKRIVEGGAAAEVPIPPAMYYEGFETVRIEVSAAGRTVSREVQVFGGGPTRKNVVSFLDKFPE